MPAAMPSFTQFQFPLAASAPRPSASADEHLPIARQTPSPFRFVRGSKRRGNLPKSTTDALKSWLLSHAAHPYPTEDEKLELATRTSLTVNQVCNWFINGRRRILQPMIERGEVGWLTHIIPIAY